MRTGFDLIRDAYAVPDLGDHERAVLALLAFMAREDKGNTAWPSIRYLVETLGKSERTIQRAIASLVEKGHIGRRQRRHDTAVYTVHPRSDCEPRPVSVTPVTATPVSVTPVREDLKTRQCDTLTTKNNHSSTKTSSSPKKRAREAVEFEPPDWVPTEPWNDFLEQRRANGAKPTRRALELAVEKLKELADAGHPPGRVLAQSTANSWTGLFEIKDRNNGPSSRKNDPASTVNGLRGSRPNPLVDEWLAAKAAEAAEQETIGDDPSDHRRTGVALSAIGGG